MDRCPACGGRNIVFGEGIYECIEPGCGEVWDEDDANPAVLTNSILFGVNVYDDEDDY